MRKLGLTLSIFLFLTEVVNSQTSTNSVSYSTPDRGGTVIETAGGTEAIVVGYGRVQPAASTAPNGVAIFSLRENGILITEAGVPATTATIAGRTYAEVNGPINTGVAFVNPNSTAVVISFHFTGENGNDFGNGTFTLEGNAQIGKFLNQAPFNANVQFAGTFSFTASAPVSVIALRTILNSRNEFLMATQVVTPIPDTTSAGAFVMAHFADGGGWRTQVVLVNTTDVNLTGTVQFYGEGSASVAAQPLTLNVNGQVAASFNYQIRARSSVRLVTSSPVGIAAQVGSVRITPSAGSQAPSGFAVFSFTNGGVLQTEAAVPAQPASTAFRSYVEVNSRTGNPGAIQSAIAISNPSSTSATVNFELTTLAGASTGLTATRLVPANGHISTFVHDLFPTLDVSANFRGVLRITSGASPVVIVSLRTRYNERGDFLITTTPASNEAAASTTGEIYFPHIVDQGGYSTQFILFSGVTGQTSTGNLRFFSQAGQSMNVRIR
ncbi:MAG: hypothetical protein HY646_04635 [Acidobacteria bacterium]|nr:hypothetical protein [Acidobacteriota bacterium]